MRQVFTTESISEDDRLDYWNHVASTVFWPLRVGMPPGTRYVASVTHEVTGALELSTVSGNRHDVHHTGPHASSTSNEKVALGLQVSGLAGLAQDGRACTLAPGEAALFDPSRPYSMRSPESFSLAVFMVPGALVRSVFDQTARVTATPLRPLTGVTSAALAYLTCLAQLSMQGGITDLALCNGSLGIVGTLLRGLSGDEPHPPGHNEIHDRATAFIDLTCTSRRCPRPTSRPPAMSRCASSTGSSRGPARPWPAPSATVAWPAPGPCWRR